PTTDPPAHPKPPPQTPIPTQTENPPLSPPPPGVTQTNEPPTLPTPASEPIADLTPRNLQIEPKELEFVETLGPLIPSPRSAKRLVNLYRIVRAKLDNHALDRFLAGGYQTTLLLLGAVVGCPSLAAELFGEIFRERVKDAQGLSQYLSKRGKDDPHWRVLNQLLSNRPEFSDWQAVRAAVRACARYSFETGRVLRTDSQTPPSTSDGARRALNQPPAKA